MDPESTDHSTDVSAQRLRRPEPKRTAPIRNAAGYFRDSHSWGEDLHPPWSDPADVLDDAVTHGVRLGYRVLGEHLLRGRDEAAKLSDIDDTLQQTDPDLPRLIERVQGLSKDFGALCFDALDLLARSPALLRWLSRGDIGPGRSSTATPSDHAAFAARAPAFPIEVMSKQRVLVNLQLSGNPESFYPGVHALHGRDPNVAPITGVVFRDDPEYSTPILSITVPDRQPPALYTGVIVDRASNEPKGTVSVRIIS